MKTFLTSLLITFGASAVFANYDFESFALHHRFEMQAVEIQSKTPVYIQVQSTIYTYDSCNHFSLDGQFRKIEIPAGVTTTIQDVLADFQILQTKIGCPRLDHPRFLDLRSPLFRVHPIEDTINLHVLVPEGMRLFVYLPQR